MIRCEQGNIEYEEHGQGPTIVLVPGSCSTGAAWRPVINQWNNEYRCVTTSLLGYGGTAERRTSVDTDISHHAEIVEAVIRRASSPVHLVGHSFGGLVALAVAIRNRERLLSLTIIEAPAPMLLRHAGDMAHYLAFRRMTDDYISAYRMGDRAAIKTMIDFYGGIGTFSGWPQRVRSFAMETTAVNMLDWSGAYGFHPTPAGLASIAIPGLVVWGERSHPAVRRANEILGQWLKKSSTMTIADAAHFMIMTHAPLVAQIISHHVRRTEPVSRVSRIRRLVPATV